MKKRTTKIIAGALAIASIMAVNPIKEAKAYTSQGERYFDGFEILSDTKVKFKRKDGTYVKNEWVHKFGSILIEDDDKWIYCDNDGFINHGWINVNGKWYYQDGKEPEYDDISGIRMNCVVDDYFLGADGAMITNSWGKSFDNSWYYAGSDGKILKNTITPDGYRVNSRGKWI